MPAAYKKQKDYDKAIYWYEYIFTLKNNDNYIGIKAIDSWNFIPAIELAVCYYNIGDIQRAIFYNEKAGAFKNNHESVVHNRIFFKQALALEREKKTFYMS